MYSRCDVPLLQGMSAAMKSMNLEKISSLMDKFEKEFEDLDVQTSVMEGAMSQTTATNIPQDAVESLMKQVGVLSTIVDQRYFLRIRIQPKVSLRIRFHC